MVKLSYNDYQVGIICALPLERTAVEAMLDGDPHDSLENKTGDSNTYSFGKIGEHNVVVASLGHGDYGTVSASRVATHILRSFRSIKYGFMVGIAGAMPRPEDGEEGDVRLGDIVVGSAKGVPSVINYALGKEDADGDFDIRSQFAEPPPAILAAIAALQSRHTALGPTYLRHLKKMFANSRLDRHLIPKDYYNLPLQADCLYAINSDTGKEEPVKRSPRYLSDPPEDLEKPYTDLKFVRKADAKGDFFEYPKLHYGSIASADKLVKNRDVRNLWYGRIKNQTKAKVLCFEMEASGIVKEWPCVAIRGICDYCDSHKNDHWQNFAAATAAAYTKDLLYRIAPGEVEKAKVVNDIVLQSITIGVFNFGDPGSERERILNWLKPDGIVVQTDRLNKLRKDCQENNTGRWIRQDLFTPWFNDQDARSLWLHGPVGCGKSVICSMIVDELRDYLSDLKQPGLEQYDAGLFVLFSFDDPVSQSLMFVLRFLLFQLSIYGTIPEEVATMYRNNPIGPSEKDFCSILFRILERIQRQQGDINETGVQRQSPDPAYNKARSMTLIVDSIDELSSVDFKAEVLGLVSKLQAFALRSAHFPFRIVLCSRFDSEVADMCKLSTGWYITQPSIKNTRLDIANFVSKRVHNHPRMKKMAVETQDMICEKVNETAQDMFRLAALYMDELSRWNVKDLEEDFLTQNLFSELPKDLDQFYDYILDRIQPQQLRSDMFVILKWVLTAARPLTVAEIKHACAIDPQVKAQFRVQRHLSGFLDCLVGLVIVNQSVDVGPPSVEIPDKKDLASNTETQTVSFEHFSVKEYLLRMTSRGWSADNIRFSIPLSQLYATKCCLAYLAHCNQDALGRTSKWVFRAYAWHHWAWHLAASLNPSSGSTASNLLQLSGQDHSDARALKIHNTMSFPFVRYQHETIIQQMPELRVLEAGGVGSMQAFEAKYSRVLRDPEYPLDFLDEDLRNLSPRRPIYQENGPSDPRLELLPLADFDVADFPRYESGIRPGFEFRSLGSCTQSLRLVALHPCLNESGIIMCSQLTETLHNAPCFTALSYQWYYGDEQDDTILLNGRELLVRVNIASALRQLRHRKRPRILWIDALCIDMSDMAEWGAQIRIMDKVYREAEEVVVWLGSASEQSDEIFDAIAQAVRPELNSGSSEARIRLFPDRAMAKLFEHRIWDKLWILMEVVLATQVTIAWGGERLSWDVLERCADIVERRSQRSQTQQTSSYDYPEKAQMPPASVPRFKMYRDLRHDYKSEVYPSFPELLFKTRHLEVSNPLDKLLTMSHLLSPQEREHITPLLDRNRSDLEMAILVGEYCLKKLNTLDILSINNPQVLYGDNQTPEAYFPVHHMKDGSFLVDGYDELPSWVPMWHWKHWGIALTSGSFDPGTPRRYSAGGQPPTSIFALNGRTLSVHGFEVGRIEHMLWWRMERTVSSTMERNPPLSKALFDRYGGSLHSMRMAVSSTCYAGFQLPDDASPLTTTLMTLEMREYPERFPESECRVSDEGETLGDPSWFRKFRKIESRAGFWNVEERYWGQRVVCLTSEGHLALVPSWSQEGDRIEIFLGGDVPYVIRETNDGKQRLIGDCYVHGIMHGEVVPNEEHYESLIHQVDLI